MNSVVASGSLSLHWLDWAVVIAFLAVVVLIALRVRFSQTDKEDFFLAGRSIGWVVVAFSFFATSFSSISFVGEPGEAYNHGLLWSLTAVGQLLVMPLGIVLFLRFFFRTKTFTAYEYLERRFNLPARLAGATVYVLQRIVFTGVILYSIAVVFESLVGWDPYMTVLGVGVFTILYTTTGGMKAVMFTDVLQGVVLLVGIGAMAFKIMDVAGFDLASIYGYAADHRHGFDAVSQPEFYSLDLRTRFSFWLLLFNVTTAPLLFVSADQLSVQRLLAAKGYGGARKAVWANAFAAIPVKALYAFVGIGLFYFYGRNPELLPDKIRSDQVLGHFIKTQMPTPLPGLIVAAVLAAMMSTVDSVMNSVANVIHSDFLIRLRVMKSDDESSLRLCRVLSVATGAISIGAALLLTRCGEGVRTSVLEVCAIWSSLWWVLLATFLVGVLVPRVSGPVMVTSMVLGAATTVAMSCLLYYPVPAEERISFLWFCVPGFFITFLAPLVLSLLWPNTKNITGLTLWTLNSDGRTAEARQPGRQSE